MKKHISIIMLGARATFYKILAVTALMAALQAGLFYFTGVRQINGGTAIGLSTALEGIQYIWSVAFVLVCLVLCTNGLEKGSRVGYTIRRLGVTEKVYTLWMSLYHFVCFIVFWGLQLVIIVLLSLWYGAVNPDAVNGQTFLLASYKFGLLHSLLPLAEWSRVIRNILLFICLGIGTAQLPVRARHGGKDVMAVLLIVITAIFFPAETGKIGNDIILSLIALICMAVELVALWRVEYDERMA